MEIEECVIKYGNSPWEDLMKNPKYKKTLKYKRREKDRSM